MFKSSKGVGLVLGKIFFVICFATAASTAMAQDKLLFDDPRLMIPAHHDSTMALVVGDVDNDGDLDLLAGNYGVPDRLYLNSGEGLIFDAGSQLSTRDDRTRAAAIGDLDSDGDLDLFVVHYMQQNRLYINDGTGIFIDASNQIPADQREGCSVTLGDVDNDGDLDIFVGNGDYPNRPAYNCLYLNDGTGVFSDASNQIPSHISRTYATAMGDVDDDGDLDVFVGNHSSPNQLYLNDGTGWFTDATNQIPDHDNSTTAAVFGDVDGDGDLDVLLGNYWMRDQLYLNDGTGCFIDATSQFPDSGAKTEDMEIGDVDGDDDLDVLIGTEYQAFLLLNDGTGLFSDATDQLPDGNMWYYDVVLADLDGDDDLDALIGTISQNRILLNNGAGLFSDYTSSISPDSHSASSVALGDLDGDGDLDAVVGNWDDHYFSYGEPNHVYINDGLGRWRADPDRIPEIDEDTTVVALGDVDSDGDLDLFVGNDDWPNSCRLYMNNGKGWFFDASKLLPEGDHTLCAAFGDVDGDGDLDIFCGTSYWDDYLYLNNGNGGFFDASRRLPSHWDRTMAAAFGDVDGDNDLDLFISDDAYGRNRLYLNDGNGLFSDATNQIPPAGYDDILSIALGDVDNDGDLDAFLASDEDRLYLNDGTGWFSDATSQIPIDNEESHSVALGDVDNDGDLDAIMGNYDAFHYPREINLYLNDGQGHFVDASHLVSWNGGITFALALGDLDGDGDLDVFTGKRYQDRLFFNLTNHLACRGVPRVGKPFSMEVCGPPNGWYILAASTHSDNVPMPPLGDLRILLDGVIYRSSDSLDSEGRAVLEFEVPPFPAIVGKRLYWQAFVWNPGHFTNLEVTTLTDL